jgi:hypothetical protein
MPTPKIWETADDLVVALKKDWNTHASKLRNADADWESSIQSAVSGNTFRAFRNLPHRPSRVFREWAFDALITRGYIHELKKVRTQENYDQWLDKLVSDFSKYWKRKMKVSIPFGPSYKLPNLLMKVSVRGFRLRIERGQFASFMFLWIATRSLGFAAV